MIPFFKEILFKNLKNPVFFFDSEISCEMIKIKIISCETADKSDRKKLYPSIRLKSGKFGVAKVKIPDLRTLLYKWIPPPRVGGSILKSPDLSDFEGRIPRLKEKRWENKKFTYKSPPQAEILGYQVQNR